MSIKSYLFILFAAYFATFLRLLIDNNILVSLLGSFVCGFVIARRFNSNRKNILLIGFCSCFTSFSGFIYYLYQLSNEEEFLSIFFNANVIIISNILIMYFGFLMSRKIT